LQYIIFPLQFLFLYSYHPTGPMGDLPKRLEAAWREKHRESAQKAFAASAAGQGAEAQQSFFAAAE
jgi:zeaxanthin epoxidase